MSRFQIQQKKKVDQFRMLRCLSIDDNIRRLKKHAGRLVRKLRGTRPHNVRQLRNMRTHRVADLAHPTA